MSESRLYDETPCEHGEMGQHGGEKVCAHDEPGCAPIMHPYKLTGACPGGSRRQITVDYEAAAKTYHDAWIEWWDNGRGLEQVGTDEGAAATLRIITEAVDAALSGREDD